MIRNLDVSSLIRLCCPGISSNALVKLFLFFTNHLFPLLKTSSILSNSFYLRKSLSDPGIISYKPPSGHYITMNIQTYGYFYYENDLTQLTS